MADFADFAARADFHAMLSGLSETVLHLTVPGVPDIFQGGEISSDSFVDPDNRAPVDFAQRQALLVAAMPDAGAKAGTDGSDGAIKARVLSALLRLRRRNPALFRDGSYEPLATGGTHADRLVAFVRRRRGDAVLVLAGRLFATLLGADARRYEGSAWQDTHFVPPRDLAGIWSDILTGASVCTEDGRLAARTSLSELPAAVLVKVTSTTN